MLEFVSYRSLTPKFGPWVVWVGLDNGRVTVVVRRRRGKKRTATFTFRLIPQEQAQPPKPELRNPTWQ